MGVSAARFPDLANQDGEILGSVGRTSALRSPFRLQYGMVHATPQAHIAKLTWLFRTLELFWLETFGDRYLRDRCGALDNVLLALICELGDCLECFFMSPREESCANLNKILEKMVAPAEPNQATANPQKPYPDTDLAPVANVETVLLLIEDRLARRDERQAEHEAMLVEALGRVVEALGAQAKETLIKKTWFTTGEFAAKVLKDGLRKRLTARTVQRWCREQRLKYKEVANRGKHGEYRILVEEYERFARDGLLPSKNQR